MTAPGHGTMTLRHKKDMNTELEPLWEDQEDSCPFDLEHRISSEELGEILDGYTGGMKRSLLTKEKELFVEANACVETISRKLGDGYSERQDLREKPLEEWFNQVKTFFEELERAEKTLMLVEQNFKEAFSEQQKFFRKVRKGLKQILQAMKAAHKRYKQNVAA